MSAVLAGVVLVTLVLLVRRARRRVAARALVPGLVPVEPGGSCWARDPLSGVRDRVEF